MKPVYKIVILALVLSGMVISCAKDEDDPGGNTTGDQRDAFVANWTCQATSKNFGTTTYTIMVKKDSGSSANILIYNFDNLGNSISAVAVVSGSTFNIPQQSVGGNQVKGSGFSSSATKMKFEYTLDDGVSVDSVSADCTKQ